MAEELFLKSKKKKLKFSGATLGKNGELIKASKGRRDLKYIII